MIEAFNIAADESPKVESIDNGEPSTGVVNELEQASSELDERIKLFLRDEMRMLTRFTGLNNIDVSIGKKWATNTETGAFTIDPSFFAEKGYTPEYCIYATLHELLAHVRDIQREPVYAARQRKFSEKGDAEHLFNNILTDIHGNKRTHAVLPSQEKVGAKIYNEKLFPLIDADGNPVDYAAKPLHIQFLYKIIRQEMIPDSETEVRPEVDDAINGLRKFGERGVDMIKYLTDPNSKMKGTDRFDLQLDIIYPIYQQLLQKAKQEDKEKKAQSKPSGEEESKQGEAGKPELGQGQPDPDQNESGEDKSKEKEPFSEDYADYFENKHPEPLSPEENEKMREAIKKALDKQREAARKNPTDTLNNAIRQETGFSLKDFHEYSAEVAKNRQAIDELREIYKLIIANRIAEKRGLSRRTYAEGDLLDPNRLAQTIIDIKSGVSRPEAFQRYERQKRQAESVGKTDFVFVFDRSGSMSYDGKAESAATGGLIMLEALAGMQRDIEEAERLNSLDLDLDIRTACITFDDNVKIEKPLSTGLTDRERLSVYKSVKDPGGMNSDSVALKTILDMPNDPDRIKVAIIVSDGKADDTEKSRQYVLELRAQGWHVYGVAIGSTEAEELYAPHSKLITDPKDLPDALRTFVETSII